MPCLASASAVSVPMKAAAQGAMLVLSLLVSSSSAAVAHVSLRATHQLQAHAEVPVTTTDIGKARIREARDLAWKAAGEATNARAATSEFRSNINKLGAAVHSDEAAKEGSSGTDVYLPKARMSEAGAKAALMQALANEAKVKGILATVDAASYKSAQAAAAKEVAKLEAESKKYWKSLVAKFKALADPGPPTAAQAAAKAAQPYIDTELRVGALVTFYNEKATATITAAQQTAMQAKAIATTAQGEQAVGIVDMAQRHMMQAHMLVGAANLKKQEAFKIRKLAESLNMSIPSYQRAAQMAAAHALATFTGLQVEDKAHGEMRLKVAKSTQEVDKAMAALEDTLAQTSKTLDAVTAKVL